MHLIKEFSYLVLPWYERISGFIYKHTYKNIVLTCCIGLLIVYCGTFIHITSEFFFRKNFKSVAQHADEKNLTRQAIPKIIHQIFFQTSDNSTSEAFMKKYQNYPQTWKILNPNHKYILWNSKTVEKLLREHYPEAVSIFKRYKKQHWIYLVDIARYFVVHHMGGVYVDMDVECKQSLDNLYKVSEHKDLMLYYTSNPFGISNDFFVASKHHDFFTHVLDGMEDADVKYPVLYMSTMFKTGPMFLYGRYLNYPFKEKIYLIPEDKMNSLMFRNFARSWHSYDGKVIRFVSANDWLWKLVCAVLIVVGIIFYMKRSTLYASNETKLRIIPNV